LLNSNKADGGSSTSTGELPFVSISHALIKTSPEDELWPFNDSFGQHDLQFYATNARHRLAAE
jgi:hypothetical protein